MNEWEEDTELSKKSYATIFYYYIANNIGQIWLGMIRDIGTMICKNHTEEIQHDSDLNFLSDLYQICISMAV